MEKNIFVIEDKLKDMDSFFIFLHELLLGTLDQKTGEILTPDQVKVFFLHICWDAETKDGAKNEFNEIYSIVQNCVKKVTNGNSFQIDYDPVLRENSSYNQSSSESYSKEIFEEINRLRGNENDYVVLMDVILNDITDKDMNWLVEKKNILSSCLYRRLPKDRCIAYSKYPKASVLESWRELAGINEDDQVFKRVYFTRSRGVYLPLEEKLHRILNVMRHYD